MAEEGGGMSAPDPVPAVYIRDLCEQVGGQLAASRLLHVDGRTVRKWVLGERSCPWASAELLRRMATTKRKAPPGP